MDIIATKLDHKISLVVSAFVLILMGLTLFWLLAIVDSSELKSVIEDDGVIQSFGFYSIALALIFSLIFIFIDPLRRRSYIFLSYLLLFYTLREGDYHYKVSEYAKATQIKRFYSHDMIPVSTKILMASITLLFLYCFYQYIKDNKAIFISALKSKLPWALFTFFWGAIFFISQLIDQLPFFHNAAGQAFEEVFEASAELLALFAVLLFRYQSNKKC